MKKFNITKLIEDSKNKKIIKDASAEAEDVYEDLLDRLKMKIDDGDDIDDAIFGAIDEGLIYDFDIFNLADKYINGSPVLELYYDDLYNDLYADAEEYIEEKEEEEEEDEDEDLEDSKAKDIFIEDPKKEN